jgi:hypothetical protein
MSQWHGRDGEDEEELYRSDLDASRRAERGAALMVLVALGLTAALIVARVVGLI